MRYLVIAECMDVRTGKRFAATDEFLPEPDERQAARLFTAGCIEPLPDGTPELPADELEARTVAQLHDIAKAEEVHLGSATLKADIVALIRTKRESAPVDLDGLDHGALIELAAAEQIDVPAEADVATIRHAIAAAREAARG